MADKREVARIGITGSLYFIVIMFIISFVPPFPVPFTDGLYFYFIEPSIQYLFRSMLYFVLLIGVQAILIYAYYRIGAVIVKNAPKIKKFPFIVDEKLKAIFKI